MRKIESFRGEFTFLSNFYPATIWDRGIPYPTAEHAFQAAKTLDFNLRRMIAMCETPGKAKRMGRKVPLRPDWDKVKLSVMERIVRKKFECISDLKAKLLATGDAELVEGNTWNDRFWGVCNGVGANHLGKLLMKIRKEMAAV